MKDNNKSTKKILKLLKIYKKYAIFRKKIQYYGKKSLKLGKIQNIYHKNEFFGGKREKLTYFEARIAEKLA